jgi:molybdopterin synthase sulfur carrier subunit
MEACVAFEVNKGMRKMKIRFYANLREMVGGKEINLALDPNTTVRAVLRRLSVKYPELGQKLWDEDEVLRGYVKVLKEGRDIRHLQGLDTAIVETDILSLFPPVGGG